MVLDRLIKLREEDGLKFKFFIQADALCHKTEGFIEKCDARRLPLGLYRAGEHQPGKPDGRQEAAEQDLGVSQDAPEWKKHGVMVYAGYITGFPFDTPESILRDVEIIKRELAIELVEFFYLTPLPGSEDHKRLTEAGTWMDPDMNKYSLSRARHASHQDDATRSGSAAITTAWESYYDREHIETIMRRVAANGKPLNKADVAGAVVLGDARDRRRASGRGRLHPSQGAHRAAAGNADRKPTGLLSEIRRRTSSGRARTGCIFFGR